MVRTGPEIQDVPDRTDRIEEGVDAGVIAVCTFRLIYRYVSFGDDDGNSATEIVLVAPVYDFGNPAAMKAWVDQVCRAGRTFRFTETGPEGLVHAERAWIVTASGGTVIGSAVDFNTGYLRAILGFLGVHDVRVVAAEQLQLVGEAGVAKAYADLDTHALI